MKLPGSLIIKKCIVGTLPLGLAGSGTNKFSALTLENLKYRPLDDALDQYCGSRLQCREDYKRYYVRSSCADIPGL